ncbi:2OG-Fe(II) oxygenase [Paraburkholderia jirisanensis]
MRLRSILARVCVLLHTESLTHVDARIADRHHPVADDLDRHGWSVRHRFLSAGLTRALALECRALGCAGALQPAHVGQAGARVRRPDVRGDQIRWLEPGQSLACDCFLAEMEALRIVLNRELCLGLADYEGHFACYAPGACYAPHRDQFRHDDRRVVTVIVYLNDAWCSAQGGALRLHPERDATVDVTPLGRRIAVFMSGSMLHEVLPATRERLSIAGWFRRR